MTPNYYAFATPLLQALTTVICVVVWSHYRRHRYLLWFSAAQLLFAVGLSLQMLMTTTQRLQYSPLTTTMYLIGSLCLAHSLAQRLQQPLRWRGLVLVSLLTALGIEQLSVLESSGAARLITLSLYVAVVHAMVLWQLRHAPLPHAPDRISVALYAFFALCMLTRLLLLHVEIHDIDRRWISHYAAWWLTTAGVMVLCVGLTTTLTASALVDTTLHLRQERDVDSLTGVLNRRAFEERCTAQPYAQGFGVLVLLDVDHFKRINDTHGHATGDTVLRALGTVLRQHLRTTDVVGRLGGEEFAIALQAMALPQALGLVERLGQSLRAQPLLPGGTADPITASYGVIALRPREPLSVALERADQLLYQAKAAGRNCVRAEWGAA